MIRPWRSASRNSTPEISSMLWQRNQGIAKVLYHTASIAEIFVASPVDFRAPKVWMNLMQVLQFGFDCLHPSWQHGKKQLFLYSDDIACFNRHENCMKPWLSHVPGRSLCRIGVQTAPRFFATPPSGLATWPQRFWKSTTRPAKWAKWANGSLGSPKKPSQKK